MRLLILFAILALSRVHAKVIDIQPWKDSGAYQKCLKVDQSWLSVVNTSGIYTDGKKFKAQCMGYSPTPIGYSFEVNPHGDYYTSNWKNLWERDLLLMHKAGLNLVRLWNWNLQSDHTEFLDKCKEYGMRVLVPFIMNIKIYPDLKDMPTRRLALENFRAFLERQNHPAVFGYLIGNELNKEFQTQLPELFSLVNQMVFISNQYHLDTYFPGEEMVNGKPRKIHPITIPLADDGSFHSLLQDYNEILNISYWSLQTYRNPFDDGHTGMGDVFNKFSELTQSRRTHLMITEFGADSNSHHPERPKSQAEMIKKQWETVRDGAFSLGGCIMEFNDEWCKGTFSDTRNPGPCPSYQYKSQSPCSHNVSYQLIYEEYMGLVELWEGPSKAGNKLIRLDHEYCIKPKEAYFAIGESWNGSFAKTSPCIGSKFHTQFNGEDYCCSFDNSFKLTIIAGGIIGVLATAAPFAFVIMKSCLKDCACVKKMSKAKKKKNGTEKRSSSLSNVAGDTNRRVTKEELSRAFSMFRPRSTKLLRERLLRSITDMLDAQIVKDYDIALRVVYQRYMEGYYIWKGKKDFETAVDTKKILDELALYIFTCQTAGTINHSPEKVMEVYDFLKEHLLDPQHDPNIQRDVTFTVPAKGKQTEEYIRQIFEYYYYVFKYCKLTFDDINYDGMRRKNFTIRLWNYKPFLNLRFFDKKPAALGTHDFWGKEHEFGKGVHDFLAWKKVNNPKTLTKWFPERGGLFTLVYNYNWYIRLNYVMAIIVWALIDKGACPNAVVTLGAKGDVAFGLLIWLLNFWVVGLQHTKISHFFSGVFWFGMTFVIFYLKPIKAITVDIGVFAVSLDLIIFAYLLLRALKIVVQEIYLNFFVSVPFDIAGRLSRQGWRGVLPKRVLHKILTFLFNLVFWVSVIALNIVLFTVFEPTLVRIDFDQCICTEEPSELNMPYYHKNCALIQTSCYSGVIITWIATILVFGVINNICYQAGLLVYGIIFGTIRRVGNVKTWSDVTDFQKPITEKNFKAISYVFKDRTALIGDVWEKIIEAMGEEDILSEEEETNYKKRLMSIPPNNKEAKRRLIQFLWSLESMTHWHNRSREVYDSYYTQRHRVRTMPSWTVMVPVYSETIIYSIEELLRPPEVKVSTGESIYSRNKKIVVKETRQKISKLEYLAGTFTEDWEVFVQRKIKPLTGILNPQKALKMLIRYELRDPEVIKRVRLWCSLRGQTLCKTVRGLHYYRDAIRFLLSLEEPDLSENELDALVDRKFQILITHQRFSDAVQGKNNSWLEAMELLKEVYPHFDLAFNIENARTGEFKSCCFTRDTFKWMSKLENENGNRRRGNNVPAEKSLKLRYAQGDYVVVKRPGPLKLGEGKAENQIHALPFALHQVIQVNDMNQDNSFEDAIKVPTLLYKWMTPTGQLNEEIAKYDHNKVIPKYRVVGFPEHCFTRDLSKVGEFMGSAEWTFVTITQRTLSYPLATRLHYGHPDFFDGYWVRTRGGPSKASLKVNVNEDIFAGYEMMGRGEKIAYVEFIQQKKGRESEFLGSYSFEAKLAQGAAQQVRSREVYKLNKRLGFMKRLALLHGTIGFYLTNTLLEMTIDLYIYSLLLFQIGGLSYNKLGLLGSKLAVPYLLQVGFVQAVPMWIEMCIQMGILSGTAYFIRNLPLSMVFFIFHLKTKSYYFIRGLLTGTGSYIGTGRLFGLEAATYVDHYIRYANSHFKKALILLGSVLAYWLVTTDSFLTALVRTSSTTFLAVCWLSAPMIFNPFASQIFTQMDSTEFRRWIGGALRITDMERADYEEHDGRAQKQWWSKRTSTSWFAWWMHIWIMDNEAADQMGTGERLVYFIVSIFSFCLSYLPWVLLGAHFWTSTSLSIAGCGIVMLFVYLSTIFLNDSQHALQGIMKLPSLVVPVFFIAFYYIAVQYAFASFSLRDITISLVLFAIILYGLQEIVVNLYGLLIVFRTRNPKKKKPTSKVKRTFSLLPAVGSGSNERWTMRTKFTRSYVSLQRLWPFLMYWWFAIVGTIITLFGESCTALLFNARVAGSYQTRLWFEGVEKPDDDGPPKPNKPRKKISKPSTDNKDGPRQRKIRPTALKNVTVQKQTTVPQKEPLIPLEVRGPDSSDFESPLGDYDATSDYTDRGF